MLSVFACCDPYIKNKLLQSFCLSLYGSSLWKVSASELHHLEVTFNNILRKIWSLPRRCHTSILHSVANLPSMYNLVVSRSKKLSLLACNSPSSLLSDIFTQCQSLAYTSMGYNMLYGHRHLKSYSEQDRVASAFIRIVKMDPEVNQSLHGEVIHICTA